MRRLTAGLLASFALTGLVACDGTTDPDPGNPVDLTYAPCVGAPEYPAWFAFQDGDGAWTRVQPTNGAFEFTISQGRGAIAYHTDEGLAVEYASTEEFEANLTDCVGSVRSVAGTATTYSTLDNVRVVMGNSQDYIDGGSTPAPGAFSLDAVGPDVTDLIAVRYRLTNTEEFPTSIVLRRSVTGSTTAPVDFGSVEAAVPVQRNVNVTNVFAGEDLRVLSQLTTPTTVAPIAFFAPATALVSGATIAPFYGVSASRLAAGEGHRLFALAERVVSTTATESRFTSAAFVDPVDRAVTLGPSLGGVVVSGTSRPAATYTIQAEYDNLWTVAFEQSTTTNFRRIEVVMTRGYAGSGSTVTLAVPNLSGVAGFQQTWLLVPGTPADWEFLATDADPVVLAGAPLSYQGATRGARFTP